MLSSDTTQKPCADDPETFFSTGARQIKRAKATCAGCPFKFQCLMECLETETLLGHRLHGVFGGVTRAERIKHNMTAEKIA